MAALVKQMSQMSMLDKIRAMTGLGRAGAFNPGAKLVAPKQGTGKRLSPKEREKPGRNARRKNAASAASRRTRAATRAASADRAEAAGAPSASGASSSTEREPPTKHV